MRLIDAIETYLCRVSTEEALLIEDNDVSAIEVDGMRGTETGHCNDISGSSKPSEWSMFKKHLHPPPTTMILGAIVVYLGICTSKRKMGNGYDIWEVEGKRESRGMWMGFVPPMCLPTSVWESPPWDYRGTP